MPSNTCAARAETARKGTDRGTEAPSCGPVQGRCTGPQLGAAAVYTNSPASTGATRAQASACQPCKALQSPGLEAREAFISSDPSTQGLWQG